MAKQEHSQPSAGRQRIYAGTGLSWGFVALLVLVVAVILLVVQNTDRVRVEWAFWDFEASLAGVILVVMLAAVLVTSLVGLAWRRSRRRTLTERERVRLLDDEVAGLRAGADPDGEPAPMPGGGSAVEEAPPSRTASRSSSDLAANVAARDDG
jgi:uncharacterized integral membrane protein